MSVTNKSLVFLAITFAFSWAVTFVGWSMGAAQSPTTGVAVLALMMAGPAIGAAMCVFAFEKGRRADALGLRFKPNWWWIWAFVIAVAIAATSVLVTVLVSPYGFADPAEGVRAVIAAQAPDKLSELPSPEVLDAILIPQIVLGSVINAVILTFTEELGWRGYLHHLWRPSGFWQEGSPTKSTIP